MAIILKNITLRNFLSIGQVTQAVNFDRTDLTLILGENLDLGGDGARNGTGKTSLIQGLSYALFGVPINSIRKDNLVNRTNSKGMMVTLDFSVNGTEYKIERGRKPNILKFYVNNVQQKVQDDAQGENKETQVAIERVINMSADMFRHIVALNTYSEPFLALKSNEQRDIIEQLLGITLLSEKADVIKEMIRNSKDDIQSEEFKVKAIEEANKRVKEQIESLKRRQRLWQTKHDSDLSILVSQYDELSKIDIDVELRSHKDLIVYEQNKKKQELRGSLLARQLVWKQKQTADIAELDLEWTNKNKIDIIAELAAHQALALYVSTKASLEIVTRAIETLETNLKKEKKTVDKLAKEVKTLENHTCYACGQDFHDDKHIEVLAEKKSLHTMAVADQTAIETELVVKRKESSKLGKLGAMPVTHYQSEAEAIRHSSDTDNIKQKITAKQGESDPYSEQLVEYPEIELGTMPVTIYETEIEAVEHRSTVSNLLQQITNKSADTDPYSEQVVEMESQTLQEINFATINRLTKTMEHQKFLLDLLSSKDSFVRKRIIDQNLSYLNTRLTHYLDKIGLPHQVVFQNDLTVEITELGRDLDFDNLSRGERNRLILGLSFAFRDVWENLYHPINTLFIDELIDSGLDTMGVENAIAILKDMSRRRQKSIWLVSHREELAGRVPSVLKVIKEGGFTSYSSASDME
jgi:DNA repair exonuclease SbcCD ATPase subunit